MPTYRIDSPAYYATQKDWDEVLNNLNSIQTYTQLDHTIQEVINNYQYWPDNKVDKLLTRLLEHGYSMGYKFETRAGFCQRSYTCWPIEVLVDKNMIMPVVGIVAFNNIDNFNEIFNNLNISQERKNTIKSYVPICQN